MSRQILCLKCADDNPVLSSQDIAMGWTCRERYLSIHLPPQNHGFSVNGVFTKLDAVHCDLCNVKLNGAIVVARSRIPPDKEMGEWEHDYGHPVPDETVAAYRGLSK